MEETLEASSYLDCDNIPFPSLCHVVGMYENNLTQVRIPLQKGEEFLHDFIQLAVQLLVRSPNGSIPSIVYTRASGWDLDQSLKFEKNLSTLDMLYMGEADISPPYMIMNRKRSELFPHAGPLLPERSSFLYRNVATPPPRLSLFAKISWQTYLVFVGCGFVLSLLTKIRKFDCFTLAGRFRNAVYICYGVTAAVMLNYVAGTIIILFTQYKTNPQLFYSREQILDAVATNEYQPLALMRSATTEVFASILPDSHHMHLVQTVDAIAVETLVRSEKDRPYVAYQSSMNEKRLMATYCGLKTFADHLVTPPWWTMYLAPRLNESWTLLSPGDFQRSLLEIEYYRMLNKHFQTLSCNMHSSNADKFYSPVGLHQLWEVMFLTSGLLASCIVFCFMERLYARNGKPSLVLGTHQQKALSNDFVYVAETLKRMAFDEPILKQSEKGRLFLNILNNLGDL